jgi:hypothetical protein
VATTVRAIQAESDARPIPGAPFSPAGRVPNQRRPPSGASGHFTRCSGVWPLPNVARYCRYREGNLSWAQSQQAGARVFLEDFGIADTNRLTCAAGGVRADCSQVNRFHIHGPGTENRTAALACELNAMVQQRGTGSSFNA